MLPPTIEEEEESPVSSRQKFKVSNFNQQRLRAWKPVLTPLRAAITFLVLGVIFVPIGAFLLVTSNSVEEKIHDYTDCKSKDDNSLFCRDQNKCECEETIELEKSIPGPIFVYYGLTNFYQNHRRYVRSFNFKQLRGEVQSPDQLSSCQPISTVKEDNVEKSYLPCGSVANSIFNDTFQINREMNNVELKQKGIAWASDVNRLYGELSDKAKENTVKPPNWPKPITDRSIKPFKTDEPLMVWMRVSALPNFRKLFGIVTGQYKDELPSGTYKVTISYNYPVSSFSGRKQLVISNASFIGGKNPTLGITFIVVGCFYLIMALVFFILHRGTARRGSLMRGRHVSRPPFYGNLSKLKLVAGGEEPVLHRTTNGASTPVLLMSQKWGIVSVA